jgi:hypothetical protein
MILDKMQETTLIFLLLVTIFINKITELNKSHHIRQKKCKQGITTSEQTDALVLNTLYFKLF